MTVAISQGIPESRDEHMCAVTSAGCHELNNQLTIVMSGTEIALNRLPARHPARVMVLEIQAAGKRCARLVELLGAAALHRPGAG
jgi:hypothetical protein